MPLTKSNRNEYVIKVTFNEPQERFDNAREFFFGSLLAIYDWFTPAEIGCGVQTLYNAGISRGETYSNRRCTITKSVIIRKAQKKQRRTCEKFSGR